MDQLFAHLPLDRLQALSAGQSLAHHSAGAVLFADISGFTPLTEHLMRTLGSRRGAEALSRLLDQVYDPLIAHVHAYGGSVIGFSGDAITCWFPGPARPALAAALAMQAAMADLAEHQPRDLPAPLSLKVSVASGPVQRMVVGDPVIQLVDLLAGPPLEQLGEIDNLVRPGDVLVAADLAEAEGDQLILHGWADDGQGHRAARLAGLRQPLAPRPPDLGWAATLPPEQVRAWIAPAVLARLEDAHAPFLTELRPVVALFLRFGASEPAQLNAYIAWVQAVLTRYNATLIQVTLGEKGNYFYAAFGAPVAHEDDAMRAVQAALTLLQAPIADIGAVRIGIAQGIARTGMYGSAARRTYGVLGDAVNLAARLMQHAAPGHILANEPIWSATAAHLHWQPLPPLTVKGKQAAIPVARLIGATPSAPQLVDAHPARSPLVGRAAELDALRAQLDQTIPAGPGQALAIGGAAGIGKSRLVGALLTKLPASWVVVQSAAQSYGAASPYLAWIPVWQQIFAVDPAADLAANLAGVQATLARLDPISLPQLPLLGAVLGLPIPENELTRALDPRGRKTRLETMLIQVLRAFLGEQIARGRRLLLVLEDLHWLDQLSADLLAQVVTALDSLPLTLVLTTREPDSLPSAAVAIQLGELDAAAIEQLLTVRLDQMGRTLSPAAVGQLSAQIAEQAAGNPFYAEELITYLGGAGLVLDERRGWQDLELPVGLHRLVLSRVDRLDPHAQRVLKTASILGATFRRDWLAAFYPALGGPAAVEAALGTLEGAELLAPSAEPALARFKHAITREVTYESLAEASRAALHEQAAARLEQADANEHLDLLAYHYERSPNDPKAILYLARSAARAASLFANADAVHQYEAALERAARPGVASPLPRAELAGGLGDVYSQMAEFDAALAQYERARAELADANIAQAEIDLRRADVLVRATRFDESMVVIDQAEARLAPHAANKQARVILAQLVNLRSIKATRQGDIKEALAWAEQGLRHIEPLPNDQPQVAATRIRLSQALVANAAALGDYQRAHRTLTRALHLIRRYPHPVVEGELQLRRALLAMNGGKLSLAVKLFRQALPLIEATGTRDRLAYLLIPGGQTLALHGQPHEGYAWLARGTQLGQETGSTFLISSGLHLLGWVDLMTGRWDSALERLQRGRVLAAEHALRDRLASFMIFEAELCIYRGEYERSQDLLSQIMDLARQHELPDIMTMGSQTLLGYSALMQGNLDVALRYRHTRSVASGPVQSYAQALDLLSNAEWWAMVAELSSLEDHSEDMRLAATAAQNSLLFFQQHGYRFNAPFANRVNAMLAYHGGDYQAALRFINQAIVLAKKIGVEPEIARGAFWRARIAARQNPGNPRILIDLQAAAAIFQRLGAQPERDHVVALLEPMLSQSGSS